MGVLTVQQESINKIADIIRMKTQENKQLIFPDEFISAINKLTQNVKVPDNAVYQITGWSEEGFPVSVKYKIPSNISDNSIPEYAFANQNQGAAIFDKINNIDIDGSPTIANDYAFYNCTFLDSVSCYDDLIEIGVGAFQNTNIIYDHLPPKVVSIKTSAFNNVHFYFDEIPSTVKSIGGNAFYANNKITSIKFKGTPSFISNTGFKTNFLTDIYVPWAEGEVLNAPWGAVNATIHYNTVYNDDGNPIEGV